jgi:hypothetical protein
MQAMRLKACALQQAAAVLHCCILPVQSNKYIIWCRLFQQPCNRYLVQVTLQKAGVGKRLITAYFFAGVAAQELYIKQLELKQKADVTFAFLLGQQYALVKNGFVFFLFVQNNEFG